MTSNRFLKNKPNLWASKFMACKILYFNAQYALSLPAHLGIWMDYRNINIFLGLLGPS